MSAAGEKVAMPMKRLYWDEEGNRVHRVRGKLKTGIWYTPIVLASDYDALLTQRDALEARVAAMQAVVNAASVLEHTWGGEYEADTTEEEFALWDALKSYRAALATGAPKP